MDSGRFSPDTSGVFREEKITGWRRGAALAAL
jgi:hypothetical protein